MRRYQLHTIALGLMWVGGIEVMASFLAKFWFQYEITYTPWFFLAFIVGIGMYLFVRFL